MEFPVRYIKVVDGPKGKEAILVGLILNQILIIATKLFIYFNELFNFIYINLKKRKK